MGLLRAWRPEQISGDCTFGGFRSPRIGTTLPNGAHCGSVAQKYDCAAQICPSVCLHGRLSQRGSCAQNYTVRHLRRNGVCRARGLRPCRCEYRVHFLRDDENRPSIRGRRLLRCAHEKSFPGTRQVARRLERIPFQRNRNSLWLSFSDRICCGEPVPTSPENALVGLDPVSRLAVSSRNSRPEIPLPHGFRHAFFVKLAKELFHLLEECKAEVDVAIRSVPGLVSYALVRTEPERGAARMFGGDPADGLHEPIDWPPKRLAREGQTAQISRSHSGICGAPA